MDAYGKGITLTFLISLALSYPMGSLADRFHPLRVGLVVQGVYCVLTLLGGLLIKEVWAFGFFLVGHGVVSGIWMTATASAGQRLLPREKFGQLGSAGALVGSLCSITVGPAMGLFLDCTHHIYRSTFLASSGLALSALLASLVVNRKFLPWVVPEILSRLFHSIYINRYEIS
jgi:MFS family permease